MFISLLVNRQEREDMRIGLGKLKQYSAALLMMYKAKLLPEVDGSFIRNLTEHYDKRRQEAKTALETCVYLDPQYKTVNFHNLLIQLCYHRYHIIFYRFAYMHCFLPIFSYIH